MAALIDGIRAARRASTPLVGIITTDPGATLTTLAEDGLEVRNGSDLGEPPLPPPAFLTWDLARGIRPRNETGREQLAKLGGGSADGVCVGNPIEAIQFAEKLPEHSLLAMHAVERWLQPDNVQALWNLRDVFKRDHRTLILLGHDLKLPPELAGDVLTFEESLPDAGALRLIVQELYESAKLSHGDGGAAATIERAVVALSGLSAFSAEQIAAMSLSRDGVDVAACWDRKRIMINERPSLSVYAGGETMDSIGGLAQLKRYLVGIMNGKRRPGAVVWIDEIDKTFAGAASSGDSGVAADQLSQCLTYQESIGCAGIITVGAPGTGKSLIAKAAGSAGGVPVIRLDLGAAKGSLVGQSEGQLRADLAVIHAVSGGRPLFIASCNRIQGLPDELRRRYGLGTFYVDLPTGKEKAAIWPLHLKRFDLGRHAKGALPNDQDWTGADIAQCCDVADRLSVPLKEAARYVVPIALASPEKLEALRALAHCRFLSASYEGCYKSDADQLDIDETRRSVITNN